MTEEGFPTEIYFVTGLRSKGWLFGETRYMKLAMNRRKSKDGTIRGVKVWQLGYGNWVDVTRYFIDENGKAKW